MLPIALSAPAWIAAGAIMLFGVALIVRWTFGLVSEAKGLAKAVRDAQERLEGSMAEVRDLSEAASARVADIQRRRSRRSR